MRNSLATYKLRKFIEKYGNRKKKNRETAVTRACRKALTTVHNFALPRDYGAFFSSPIVEAHEYTSRINSNVQLRKRATNIIKLLFS